MTEPAISLEELLVWSDTTTRYWMDFLAANPSAQSLPCGIYGTDTVLGLVRHIVAVEVRYSQRLLGLPVSSYDEIPTDLLEALAVLHKETISRLRGLLADPGQNWAETIEFVTKSAGTLKATRRKVVAHALLHGVRHWAQLATLTRAAGLPAGFAGDLMASGALA